MGVRTRSDTRVAQRGSLDGSHVWAASGLKGFAAGTSPNPWVMAGLPDMWSGIRKDHPIEARDWVPAVAGKYSGKVT